MNMALEFSTVSKSAHLTPEQTEEFGRRVETDSSRSDAKSW